MLLLPFILLFSFVSAGPTSTTAPSIPLTRRRQGSGDRTKWLKAQFDVLQTKYASQGASTTKRANTGTESLTNQNADITYYGSVAIGTPAKNYDLVMDTGSADLWVASSSCVQGCGGIKNTFDKSKSSTFMDSQKPIDIKYGSGEVLGEIGTDTVTMAGFTVQNQPLGVMTQLSSDIVSGTISGIMGLGWEPLAQSGGTPWWESLAKGGSWAQPLFGFYITRYSDNPNANAVEPGGSIDIGFVNSSFTNINYISLTAQTYWNIPLQTITIGGSQVQSRAGAAIDTGTTLIGGPASLMDQIYSHVPGAKKGTGDLQNFYLFPCSQAPRVSLTFGDQMYAINPADFSLQADSTGEMCAGAFVGIDVGSNSGIGWVVGDAYLKNVYSVYRYSPPAVGFQALTGSGGNVTTSTSSSSSTSPTSTSTSTVTSTATSVDIASTYTVYVPPPPSTSTPAGGAASHVEPHFWGAIGTVFCLCGVLGFGL